MRRYSQVASDIRDRIFFGDFRTLERLPKQAELAQHYQTSRVTISKAIHILQGEGLVMTAKGAGTVINAENLEKKMYDSRINSPYGLVHDYSRRYAVQSDVISFFVRQPEEEERIRLRLKRNDEVYDIIRLRKLDGIPHLLEYTIMPCKVIPGLEKQHLYGSIYGYIRDNLHQTFGKSFRLISADLADSYDIQYLQAKPNTPMLEVEQVAYLDNGVPFEFSQTRHTYDKGGVFYVEMHRE